MPIMTAVVDIDRGKTVARGIGARCLPWVSHTSLGPVPTMVLIVGPTQYYIVILYYYRVSVDPTKAAAKKTARFLCTHSFSFVFASIKFYVYYYKSLSRMHDTSPRAMTIRGGEKDSTVYLV